VNLDCVEKIAEAVLYEGYMLYPYRPSSIKNQQRWNFGVLYPPAYCGRKIGSERSGMQTECLLKADPASRVTVKVRFLQIVQRSVGRLRTAGREEAEGVEPEFELVDRLEVGGRTFTPWQEAVERELTHSLDPLTLSNSHPELFTFASGKSFEYVRDEPGQAVGVLVRMWQTLRGSIEFDSHCVREGVLKLTVRVDNLEPFDFSATGAFAERDRILLSSLVSAHVILGVEGGEFISLLEPPAALAEVAAQCSNEGVWPVLAGDDPTTVLASPIILYDYPQIAPESAGSLFDSTEIDEILSLRILTLTDAEKREMRQSDDRTRQILERTENMPDEQFAKLHGILRGMTSLKEETQ
jgi:hypothetical protein